MRFLANLTRRIPSASGLHAFGTALTHLARDRRGNVLMLTGFALIPLTFATGMVIDYSRAARLQTKLNAAADAAALSSITKPMMDKPRAAACNMARRAFLNALEQNKGGLVLATNNVKITIAESYLGAPDIALDCLNADEAMPAVILLPNTRTTTVTYTAQSTNAFGGVLGAATVGIGGTSTARTAVGKYIDIHLALDTSQSMGLAATDTDAGKLWDETITTNGPDNGCTFGCHVFNAANSGFNAARDSNETIATNKGIKLRIDSLRQASMDMIDKAIEKQGSEEFYQFGLYRIGASTSTISALSTDLDATKTTVGSLKLGVNTAAGRGDTNLQDMAKTMLSTITTHGNGSTRGTAAAFLFIVTDGVQDLYKTSSSYTFNGTSYTCDKWNWDHCMSVIKTADCDKLKQNNITVGIVYTTYLPVRKFPKSTTDFSLRDEYTGLVQDIAGNIKPKLQACASESKWFLEASDGPGIEAAMKKLLTQAMETAKLTN